MTKEAAKQGPYRWIVLACIGLILGYFCSSPIPKKIYELAHRGLRRHGFELELDIVNRRPLNISGDSSGFTVTMSTGQVPLVQGFGEPMYRYFTTRDKDGNGYLDPEEFREFLRLVSPVAVPFPDRRDNEEESSSKSDIHIVANFIPLKTDTLTKAIHESYANNLDYLRTLLKWTKPHRKISRFSVADLAEVFYPERVRNMTIGSSYYLVRGKDKAGENREIPDFSNRYFLPSNFPQRPYKIISRLMGAFHPQAFPYTRYPPSGSAAVIRAINDEYVQVFFRLHTEFQLNQPPDYPFWFTPSYFIGQITFSRDVSRVLAFHLDIPKERTLNVDMEWLQSPGGMNPFTTNVEVDIGYTPKMELRMKNEENVTAVKWKKEISTKMAFKLTERQLYPFKKIDYLPFEEAFIQAEKENKFVHSVILWGSLDDQSC